jgi:hypothetical protein
MNSIGMLTASWGVDWRENWIFWLLCIAIVSLFVIVIPILPYIYPTISSPYTPYLAPIPWAKISLPVVTDPPIATENLSPVRKMIYVF